VVFVKEFGEFFEHNAAQLLGVDDRDDAAVVSATGQPDGSRRRR
jgi:hypothetical protein